jgi:hypothetical protein
MSALHPAEQAARAAASARDQALLDDPARRRAHGVVHTPPELARCVIALLDELLRSQLGLAGGACDARLQLIDPACGPGALLAAAVRLWQERGRPPGFALRGIDLDPAALASAAALASHAPAEFTLHEADALREPHLLELARDPARVLAIAGNPPWATARATATPAMQDLLEDFRRDAGGVRLPERKLGVLSDAYVRFFRLCAEAARQTSAGAVLALISNGSFLDGPVHRGMRAALVRWFDALYVLDLGGSALLQRAGTPRDDNVFGVRPSVTISWLCRRAGGDHARAGQLYYARLRGARADKLELLRRAGLADLGFEPLSPEPPLLRFLPRTAAAESEYAAWPSLAEWLPFQREGVQTNRDRVVIDRDRGRLLERLSDFARGAELPELHDQAHFSSAQARRNLAAALERDPAGERLLRPIAYRPFDQRWFCVVTPLCHRPRPELLRALEHAPEALVSVRKDRGFSPYSHFGAAQHVIDNCFLSARSSCRARAFPARTPVGDDNLDPGLRAQCSERIGAEVTAGQFQRYALAFLAADGYRRKFDAALHADYPRLPLPASEAAWRVLSARGESLWQLWTAPLDVSLMAAGEPGLRCADLRVSAADGCIYAGARRWLDAPAPVLQLWLGHVQPLRAYLLTHASETLTAQHEWHLRALAERLHSMHAAMGSAENELRQFGYL